jgi:hypothetical protein
LFWILDQLMTRQNDKQFGSFAKEGLRYHSVKSPEQAVMLVHRLVVEFEKWMARLV